MAAATWSHPTLGEFRFKGGYAWTRTISMPAFQVFSYDTGYSNAPRSTGNHTLAFEAESEADLPSAVAIELADRVLANQQHLVTAVTAALWQDFNGEGSNSGMWWHGSLAEVVDAMNDVATPTGPSDLLPLLQLAGIFVRTGVHGYQKPIVELNFHARFEEEHGIGLLTDGEAILGIGYSSDAGLFQPAKRR